MSVKAVVKFDAKKIIQGMDIPKVKRALANEMLKDFSKYVPFQTVALQKSATLSISTEPMQIIYNAPYAHYVWEGDLYLAENGSSWAKEGETKHSTGIKLTYGNGRGAKWTETAKEIHAADWKNLVQEMLKRG